MQLILNSLTIIGIAIGLAMDAFAVAVAVGAEIPVLTFRHYFRLSFHFGLFQALMPVLGWYLGVEIEGEIATVDHWVAFALLVAIGSKMIYESRRKSPEFDSSMHDPTRKWSLMALSIATSVDAFAIGLSLALLKVEILTPAVVIGIVALALTAVGMLCGRKLGERLGKRSELIGGLILIGIGLKIVVSHF